MPSSMSLITFPLLITLSFPLAITAIFTTIFAIIILALRVLLIYVELGFVLAPQYLSKLLHLTVLTPKSRSEPSSRRTSDSKTPPASPPKTRRSRRLSSTSLSFTHTPALRQSSSAISLPAHTNPLRDFEGVGGWRLERDSDSDETENWTRINSRLTLPSSPISLRHQRSLSTRSLFMSGTAEDEGGRGSWSPNTKRVRTPLVQGAAGRGKGQIGWTLGGGESSGYFPMMSGSLGGTRGGSLSSSPGTDD